MEDPAEQFLTAVMHNNASVVDAILRKHQIHIDSLIKVSVVLIIVSAIGISATCISAKNIGIGYRQWYKMYIGNQNFIFNGKIGHKIVY